MPPIKLSSEILAAAITGFEVERDRIEARIEEIRRLLGSSAESAPSSGNAKPRKKRSAAVRRRMKIAQQLRWKKIKEAGGTAQAETAKPKRTMSASARKRIAAAQRRRWALKKAAEQAGMKNRAVKKAAAKAAPSKGPRNTANKASARKPNKTVSAPDQAVAQGAGQ